MSIEKNPEKAPRTEPDKVVAAEQEKGYRGVAVDPHPNEAYSLQTGPDSPTNKGRLVQHDVDELIAKEG